MMIQALSKKSNDVEKTFHQSVRPYPALTAVPDSQWTAVV